MAITLIGTKSEWQIFITLALSISNPVGRVKIVVYPSLNCYAF